MAIHDVVFNFPINQGDQRAVSFPVEVATGANNVEMRNAFLRNGRNVFTVDLKGRDDMTAKSIMDFYKARHGKLYAFLFKDYFDYQVTTSQGFIGFSGLASAYTTVYELNMFYDIYDSVGKRIYKPKSDTFKVYIDSVLTTTGYTLDNINGKVTFDPIYTKDIVAINKGSLTVIDFGSAHNFNVSDKIYISGLPVGTGWSNLAQCTVGSKTTNTITINTNSTSYVGDYASGATAKKNYQDGTLLRFESEYYKVVRFNNDELTSSYASFNKNDFDALELIELIGEY